MAETLTFECVDEHVPILDELLDEFIGPLQLYLMAFDPLSEVRTVQERITELQCGESHRGSETVEKHAASNFTVTSLRWRSGFSWFRCVKTVSNFCPQNFSCSTSFFTSAFHLHH